MGNLIYKLPDGTPAAEWCRENKIPYGNFTRYINFGLMVEDACIAAKKAREKSLNNPVTLYKGKNLKSQFPCGYNSIMAHVRKKHCSVEEAVEIYKYNLCNRNKPRNFRRVLNTETGEQYESIVACAKAHNISPTTMRKRILKDKKKWNLI